MNQSLCRSCKKQTPEPDYKVCRPCLTNMKINQTKHREKLKRLRLCYRCRELLSKDNGVYCFKCAELYESKRKDRSSKRKLARACIKCCKPTTGDHALCYECRIKLRNDGKVRRDKHKSADICERCIKPAEVGRVCKNHYKERNQKISEAITTGKCINCRKYKDFKTIKLCLECWIKRAARNRLKSSKLSKDLLKLWHKQKARCALSDEPIIPGINAHLDHIVPIARGGSSEISNVRWIDASINLIKRDLLDEELKDDLPRIIKMFKRVKWN